MQLDDPDTGLLRFIRARKWDVSRAIAMFAGCMKWRLDNGVEDVSMNRNRHDNAGQSTDKHGSSSSISATNSSSTAVTKATPKRLRNSLSNTLLARYMHMEPQSRNIQFATFMCESILPRANHLRRCKSSSPLRLSHSGKFISCFARRTFAAFESNAMVSLTHVLGFGSHPMTD